MPLSCLKKVFNKTMKLSEEKMSQMNVEDCYRQITNTRKQGVIGEFDETETTIPTHEKELRNRAAASTIAEDDRK